MLALCPDAHLRPDTTSRATQQPTEIPQAIRAFARSDSEGLFELAARPATQSNPTVLYWQDLAKHYLTTLAHHIAVASELAPLSPPDSSWLVTFLERRPPFTGSEILNTETLSKIWNRLDSWTRQQHAASGMPLADWFAKVAPKWQQVGSICFHLAENPKDEARPFAFLATYAPRLNDAGAAQFVPLGNALRQYSKAKANAHLLHLLRPVHHAAATIPFVAQLVESGHLYQATAWAPSDAYRFLKTIPQLNEAGILTRLPNWWAKRPRPRVQVTLGQDEKTPSAVGLNSLLRFKLSVAIGDQKLSPEQLAQLTEGDAGLVKWNGQWIEADPERLSQALAHWQRLETYAADGELNFAQGMRLLAGASRQLYDPQSNDETERDIRDWTQLRSDAALAATLKQLRDPKNIAAAKQPPELRGTLRPYQQEGYAWLKLLTQLGFGACLADDMGLGKTIQVISLLLDQRKTQKQPNLLVLPASLLANWAAELQQFAPSLRIASNHSSLSSNQISNTSKPRRAAQLQDCDLVLTSYGMLLRHDWLAATQWNCVILDEAQAIKNPDTRQTRAAKALKSRSRIALTGTPIENKLSELWSLFDFINPGLLGSAADFQKFTATLSSHAPDGYAKLRSLIAPFLLRRLKTDTSIIADLPDKTEINALVPLVPEQAALYKSAVEALKKDLQRSEGIERKGLILSSLTRFKQICNHPSQLSGDNEYKIENSGKFQRLAALCEEIAQRQDKVIVFTQYRELIEPLSALLRDVFKQPGLHLHGGTPVSQRQEAVDRFQAPDGPPFFILSLKAGGTGLTLTAASHVIHFDRWWNPAVENQATDRAYRIGQKRNVLVHKFVSRGTIEEKIDHLIATKRELSDTLIEDNATPQLTELSDDALLDLVSYTL